MELLIEDIMLVDDPTSEGGKTVFRQAFKTLNEAVKARDIVLKDLIEKRGY